MPRSEISSHTPNGDHEKFCPQCQRSFRTDHPLAKYCSMNCYIAARNQRYYQRHKVAIITKVMKRRKSKN